MLNMDKFTMAKFNLEKFTIDRSITSPIKVLRKAISLALLCVMAMSLQAETGNALAGTEGVSGDAPQVAIDDSSFGCIRDMAPVRHFYVANLLGDLDSTLAAAQTPEGAVYPVGSVVQLVPTEAMVKREAGTFPATGDWEFFELKVNDSGTTIEKRGFVDVVNRFGGNCFGCHAPARAPWDFICESDHGCEPIAINHKMTGALQRTDPRCGADVKEKGDTAALLKLGSMVSIGLTLDWLKKVF